MKKILYTLLIVPLLGFAQDENPCYSINDIFIQMDGENPSLEVNLVAGWNMIGYPCTQDMLLTDGFSLVDDKISMVKNNNGAVYIPEFNFNGIGFLESGQGYQVKMNEFVMGFSFCESVQYPNLEGCTDCEASNFNQLANVDDGSCNYDSDGDGVPDSEEVVGCQDSLACDYNINATDSGECFYAQDGYDCDGNITAEIGDEIEGGYLFYLDETGTRGMVAAMEDLEGVYAWGCYQTDINSDNSSLSPELDGIGTGLQNTLEIVSGCAEIPIAASEVLDFESNGFDDWYLPSKYEIIEMYDNIGQGANNIGNLSNSNYWSSSEENSISAFRMSFTNNTISNESKYNACYVRPIRAFGYTLGCMDSLACNYNPEANMADGSCEYAEQLYDCDGNLTAEIEEPICGYLPTNIDIWPYVDINIPDGYTVHSVYADFDRPGYSGPTLDFSIAYCPNCDSFPAFIDNLSDFYIWEYETISYSLYDTELVISEVSEIELNGPGTIRVLAPLPNDGWNDFCINFELVYGCMDSLACNFNSEANMGDGSCTYAEGGHDCDGSITEYVVGMEAEGGIVFYVDETGERGLVAAMEDLTSSYGCQGTQIDGADGSEIGTGYQNTLDFYNQGCETQNVVTTAPQFVLSAEINGYTDWYLPSSGELLEMYYSIGNVSIFGNIGYFVDDYYWSSSETNNGLIYTLNFLDGNLGLDGGLGVHPFRPIRAFGYTLGCMDSLACNYNPQANMADGSCTYPDLGYDCEGNITEYVVGMEAEGGIVFYVDESGERGLVAAMEDLPSTYQWGCWDINNSGADGWSIGTGYQNTLDIVSGCSQIPIAAIEAQTFESEGYSDWYLPSKYELLELFNFIENSSSDDFLQSFNYLEFYWSSSEGSNTYAWGFKPTPDGGELWKAHFYNVRPIRAFGNWIEGCMDSLACNFNPEANMADGSCEYPEQYYDCDGNITEYVVGMEAEGGIVFYVDETGEHGLVAAMEDIEGTYEWGCYETDLAGADGQAIGAGYQNTIDIVSGCSETPIAASEALAYESEGYSDWYLPSKDELYEMYNTIGNEGLEGNIGGFDTSDLPYYWSSSENVNNLAWNVNFNDGYSYFSYKFYSDRVRVIRAF